MWGSRNMASRRRGAEPGGPCTQEGRHEEDRPEPASRSPGRIIWFAFSARPRQRRSPRTRRAARPVRGRDPRVGRRPPCTRRRVADVAVRADPRGARRDLAGRRGGVDPRPARPSGPRDPPPFPRRPPRPIQSQGAAVLGRADPRVGRRLARADRRLADDALRGHPRDRRDHLADGGRRPAQGQRRPGRPLLALPPADRRARRHPGHHPRDPHSRRDPRLGRLLARAYRRLAGQDGRRDPRHGRHRAGVPSTVPCVMAGAASPAARRSPGSSPPSAGCGISTTSLACPCGRSSPGPTTTIGGPVAGRNGMRGRSGRPSQGSPGRTWTSLSPAGGVGCRAAPRWRTCWPCGGASGAKATSIPSARGRSSPGPTPITNGSGCWPTRRVGPDPGGARRDLERGAIGLVVSGLRGLAGGSSLPRLLAEQRGVRNVHGLPPLTEEQVLAWADAHHARTGRWPVSQIRPHHRGDRRELGAVK